MTTLNFSSSNEDGATELAALAGARRILCLTGTGTRVLDLLLSDAEEIVALDANPAQDALLALKIAAIARFDHDDYLAFVGIADSENRAALYGALRADLDAATRNYWDRRPRLIARGIWHGGGWERLLGWNGAVLRLLHGRAIDALMAAETVKEQAAIWQQRFGARRIGARIEAWARDLVWRLVMRETAGSYLPQASEVGRRIEADFARAAASFLFRKSDIATLSLRGRLRAGDPLPLHMRAAHYEQVRARLPRVRRMVGGLRELGRLDVGQCDGFSLSDFGSYCGADDYARCWDGILAVAAPDARFCERVFMHSPEIASARVTIDAARSAQLSASDRSIIYRVRAGTIA